MKMLDGLLSGIVSDPHEETRWMILADWLEEFDDPRRAELLRLHRKLLGTCCEPKQHPERSEWQSRIVALIAEGVRPCLPQETLTLPDGVGMTFSFIPPGSFLMGSDYPMTRFQIHNGNTQEVTDDSEKPIHRVTLTRGVFIGVHPVTQAQWKAVTGANPSRFKGKNLPVTDISWNDCYEFCRMLSAHLEERRTVRLPTEAEWEYACRAGTTTEYHFGDIITLNQVNYNESHTGHAPPKEEHKAATNVGSFPANPWGLFDVHGNVDEWCEDRFGPYAAGEQADPISEQNGAERVVYRGGSWRTGPVYCRSAVRCMFGPLYRIYHLGCRVCFRLD